MPDVGGVGGMSAGWAEALSHGINPGGIFGGGGTGSVGSQGGDVSGSSGGDPTGEGGPGYTYSPTGAGGQVFIPGGTGANEPGGVSAPGGGVNLPNLSGLQNILGQSGTATPITTTPGTTQGGGGPPKVGGNQPPVVGGGSGGGGWVPPGPGNLWGDNPTQPTNGGQTTGGEKKGCPPCNCPTTPTIPSFPNIPLGLGSIIQQIFGGGGNSEFPPGQLPGSPGNPSNPSIPGLGIPQEGGWEAASIGQGPSPFSGNFGNILAAAMQGLRSPTVSLM